MSALVLVTGALGPAGSSLLAQLRRRGIDAVGADAGIRPETGMQADSGGPDGMCLEAGVGAWGLAAGVRVHAVPPARDEGFLLALRDLVRRTRASAVIPTVSEELPVLAATPAVLGVPVVIGSTAAVEAADDKLLTCRLLSGAGVAVPAYADGAIRMSAQTAAELGSPFLSKPRVGRGGRSVQVHHEPALLLGPRPGLVLQAFAPGEEYAVNAYRPRSTDSTTDSCTDRSTDRSRPGSEDGSGVAVVLRKTELASGDIGNGTQVERTHAPDVAALALAALAALGLTGPADLDIRRRRDGRPVVLEVNARFGAHSAHAPEVLDGVLDALADPVRVVAR